jgi:two-component system alkaline phosphatase synthesis response regulator PhoP
MDSTKPSVFIIDDELDLLELTVEGLSFEGFRTYSASSGIEGLHLIRENLPDIVVSDINMPDMSGYEVLANLRNDTLTANIPFIFLSARSERAEIRHGMELGADDYLTKPVAIDELCQAIRSRLARKTSIEMNRLRDFAHQLVITQENERRSLASSLKDNLGEKLSDLKMSIDTLQKLSSGNQSYALNAAANLIGDTLNTINKLSYSLWPSVLTHLGLEAALLSLFEQVQENSNFKLDVEHYGLEEISNPQFTIMLYRIVQEALANIKHHAAVDRAKLSIWLEEEHLRLQIEDEGRGFDVQAILGDSHKIGLRSMVERAYLLNGQLTILSSPQEGTRIYGSFPLNNEGKTSVASVPKSRPLAKPNKQHETEALRIAIADSTELSRWGYRAIIETDSRFKVVAELTDWTTLRRFLDDIPIDILLISHALEGEERGLLSLQELKKNYPKAQILLLSNYTEYAFAAQALKNGISGYLLKTSGSDELRAALDALAAGKQYLAKDILTPKQAPTSNNLLEAFATLTEREKEIFYRVVNGQTNLEIANELVISSRTVETHRLNMMRKLGLTGTSALINFAINKGLVR